MRLFASPNRDLPLAPWFWKGGYTPGTKLGPYEITTPLGAGGMGEVYRARDTRLGGDVAIKILPKEMSADPARK